MGARELHLRTPTTLLPTKIGDGEQMIEPAESNIAGWWRSEPHVDRVSYPDLGKRRRLASASFSEMYRKSSNYVRCVSWVIKKASSLPLLPRATGRNPSRQQPKLSPLPPHPLIAVGAGCRAKPGQCGRRRVFPSPPRGVGWRGSAAPGGGAVLCGALRRASSRLFRRQKALVATVRRVA